VPHEKRATRFLMSITLRSMKKAGGMYAWPHTESLLCTSSNAQSTCIHGHSRFGTRYFSKTLIGWSC